jgi:hypothetical protein
MKARRARRTPITVRIPIRSKHEDLSRQHRGKNTEHLVPLLHPGPVVVTRR